MSLFFITGNKNKFHESQMIMPALEQLDMDLIEIQEVNSHAIIRAKLEEARKHHDGEFIVEDTSVSLECLGGLPGPLIKWFMETIGNEGLVEIAEKLGNNRCTVRVIIGYQADGTIEFFEGVTTGQIVQPRGDNNFGWNPIFQPDGHNKTFGEMTVEEKNDMSMRRIAFEKLKAHLNH